MDRSVDVYIMFASNSSNIVSRNIVNTDAWQS